jgi:hypothetical protein
LAEGTEFDSIQGMGTGQPIVPATDMEEAIPEIDLIPAQRNQFGHTQAVAIGQLDHRGIPVAMPTEAFGHTDETLDLCGCEVFTTAPIRIGALARWGDAMGGRGRDGRRSV